MDSMEESNQKSRRKTAVEYEMSDMNESMGQDGRRKMCKIVNQEEEEEEEEKRVEREKKDPPGAVQTSETRTGFLVRFDFHFLHLFMSNNPTPTPTFHPISVLFICLSSSFHLLSSRQLLLNPPLLPRTLLRYPHSLVHPPTTLPSFPSNVRRVLQSILTISAPYDP